MIEIISLGSINVDYVGKVPHLPVKGETVQATDFAMFPGGKGANQAVAAARMGGKVVMVGCIGEDEEGEFLKETLRGEQIKLTGLKISSHKRTGISLIGLDNHGDNTIITYPGANTEITVEDVNSYKSLFSEAKITNLHWDIKKEVGERFIEMAHENGLKVVLNLAPVRPIDSQILKLVDVLIVNEIEAKMLTNIEVLDFKSARRAADRLKKIGLKKIIITMGDNGIAVFAENKENYLSVYTVNVIDTTGAGDTFVGAFTQFFLNYSLIDAIKLASKAASLAVTKEGAINSIPELKDLDNFIEGGDSSLKSSR